MNDFQQAAERLNRIDSGEPIEVVYIDCLHPEFMSGAMDSDLVVFREHFTDPRPLSSLSDDEWREMGFVRDGGLWCFGTRSKGNQIGYGTIDGLLYVNGVSSRDTKAVGQLRSVVFGLRGE